MKTNLEYAVVGGGTAGWLTALFVKSQFPYSEVTVIASSEIGILGAGEGTTPPFVNFLNQIGINPLDIIAQARGTVKNGIRFVNWRGVNDYYDHNFLADSGMGDRALHFDANLLAKFLQTQGLARGIKLIDSEVVAVTGSDTITGLVLKDQTTVPVDFVFDCSGFARLIIGKHYATKWTSYQSILPVDRAMPFFLPNAGVDLPTYTEAVAMRHGWMWRIPVQGRYGCGYVFDSSCATDEQIHQELEEYYGHEIVSPRQFSFDAGCYDQTWVANCVAIGLSSGFSEPLEETSIWVQTASLNLLATKISGILNNDADARRQYNQAVNTMNRDIADFLHFHYLSGRNDSPFWQAFDHAQEFVRPAPGVLKTFNDHNWNSVAQGIGHASV